MGTYTAPRPGVHLSLIQDVSAGVKDFPRERSLVCNIAGVRRSTMDTLIILVALTTLAIPILAETAAATHIFDAWGDAGPRVNASQADPLL
jgi:hypothetical protein